MKQFVKLIPAWLFALVLSLVLSKLYWGYFFSPPDLYALGQSVSPITSAAYYVRDDQGSLQKRKFSTLIVAEKCVEADCYCAASILRPFCITQRTYYCMNECLLKGAGVFYEAHNDPVAVDEAANTITTASSLLDPSFAWSHAILLKKKSAEDPNTLAYFSGPGSVTDNDVFSTGFVSFREDLGKIEIRDFGKFNYEVSGLEGVEWFQMFVILGLIFSFLTLALPFVVKLLPFRSSRRDNATYR